MDSYGGFLRYKVRYELARGMLEPVQKPDVILVGAGYRLHSRGHTPTHPGTLNQRQVQLSEVSGTRISGIGVGGQGSLQALTVRTTLSPPGTLGPRVWPACPAG